MISLHTPRIAVVIGSCVLTLVTRVASAAVGVTLEVVALFMIQPLGLVSSA